MNQNTLGFAASTLFANFIDQNANQLPVSFGPALEFVLAWSKIHSGSSFAGANQQNLRALLLGLLFNLYPSRLPYFYGFNEGYICLERYDEIHVITQSTTGAEYYIFRLGSLNQHVQLNPLVLNHNRVILMLLNINRVNLINIFQNMPNPGDFEVTGPFRVFCNQVRPIISANINTIGIFHSLHHITDHEIFIRHINPIRTMMQGDFLALANVGTRFFHEQLTFLENNAQALHLILSKNNVMVFNFGALVCYQVQLNIQIVLRHGQNFQVLEDITIMPRARQGHFVWHSTPTIFHIDTNVDFQNNFQQSHMLPTPVQTESPTYSVTKARINTGVLRTSFTINEAFFRRHKSKRVFKALSQELLTVEQRFVPLHTELNHLLEFYPRNAQLVPYMLLAHLIHDVDWHAKKFRFVYDQDSLNRVVTTFLYVTSDGQAVVLNVADSGGPALTWPLERLGLEYSLRNMFEDIGAYRLDCLMFYQG